MRTASAQVLVRRPDVATSVAQFAGDVRHYLTLTPRQLPSRYLYDPLGSALFDAICQLPWYGITRAETRLLARHAHEIFTRLDPLVRIVELGSGSGEKLTALIEAGAWQGTTTLQLHLVDVSTAALASAARMLSAFAGVEVVTHQAPYESGLAEVARDRTSQGGRTLALFLGSNIGNFDPPGADALLRRIRESMRPGDALLLGADLVKPVRDLLLAYDDPLGVTAAFNRNLLVRINRELDADFDVAGFTHRAVWNAEVSRVEMHLVSSRQQRVRIAASGLDLTLQEGEPIWTESSYKYRPNDVVRLLERHGFRCRAQWSDVQTGFALTLAAVAHDLPTAAM